MRGDTSDAGSSIILMQLKDDKEQAEGEKAMLAERNRLLQVETKELTRAKDDLERLKCEIIEERRKELQPMVDAVRHEMQLLQESVILEEDKLEGAVKEAVRLRCVLIYISFSRPISFIYIRSYTFMLFTLSCPFNFFFFLSFLSF